MRSKLIKISLLASCGSMAGQCLTRFSATNNTWAIIFYGGAILSWLLIALEVCNLEIKE